MSELTRSTTDLPAPRTAPDQLGAPVADGPVIGGAAGDSTTTGGAGSDSTTTGSAARDSTTTGSAGSDSTATTDPVAGGSATGDPVAGTEPAPSWTADEMMTIAAARSLRDGQVCFVGIGLPSTAANLARRLHAPKLVLIYESGTLDSRPDKLPLSIGDGILAASALSVVSVPEVFNYWLQPGRIDVGFLSGAQLDRYGNINTTVIGTYDEPVVRLPGSGGAPEIATSCHEVTVVMRHKLRAFVEQVDFVTSVGRGTGPGDRALLGLRGAGPVRVITDLGVLEPDPETAELVLTALHPGVTVEQARAETGWTLQIATDLGVTPAPTTAELATLRGMRTVGSPS